MSGLEAEFILFDRQNPIVYTLFKRFAFEAINAGYKTIGVELIINRIRWETLVETRGDSFKINNNFKAYYARKFMRDFPEFEGLFRTRRLRAA